MQRGVTLYVYRSELRSEFYPGSIQNVLTACQYFSLYGAFCCSLRQKLQHDYNVSIWKMAERKFHPGSNREASKLFDVQLSNWLARMSNILLPIKQTKVFFLIAAASHTIHKFDLLLIRVLNTKLYVWLVFTFKLNNLRLQCGITFSYHYSWLLHFPIRFSLGSSMSYRVSHILISRHMNVSHPVLLAMKNCIKCEQFCIIHN